MTSLNLPMMCHPSGSPAGIEEMRVSVIRDANAIRIRYGLTGDLSEIVWPEPSAGQRRDELWLHTCFEAFIRSPDNASYAEFNVATNRDWAAYQFDNYRSNRQDLACPPPEISVIRDAQNAKIEIAIPTVSLNAPQGPLLLGTNAIVETEDDARSYWALHHPLNKPDFHHIDNFQIVLD